VQYLLADSEKAVDCTLHITHVMVGLSSFGFWEGFLKFVFSKPPEAEKILGIHTGKCNFRAI
jgi:hypothetical protein